MQLACLCVCETVNLQSCTKTRFQCSLVQPGRFFWSGSATPLLHCSAILGEDEKKASSRNGRMVEMDLDARLGLVNLLLCSRCTPTCD